MSTLTDPTRSTIDGEARIRLTGVDWSTFTKLASESTGARFAYDQGILEITSPGPLHESEWLVGEDKTDRSAWEARLAEWALAELAARPR